MRVTVWLDHRGERRACAGDGRHAKGHRLIDGDPQLALDVVRPPDLFFRNTRLHRTSDPNVAARPCRDAERGWNAAQVDDADVDAASKRSMRGDPDDGRLRDITSRGDGIAQSERRFQRCSSLVRDIAVLHKRNRRTSLAMLDPQSTDLLLPEIGPYHIR